MNLRTFYPPARIVLLLLAGLSVLAWGAIAQTRIVVNGDLGRDTISRYIYGTFSEHLGHCIYGGFYVGDGNTAIPNTRGMRNDIVAALKKIRTPVLRWPGGCFADTYHWKDGIGPKAERPSIVNAWWGGVTEDNSFGTHEFLDLCEQLGAEPYITGNVGSGTVQELSQWVQYVDFDGVSPMSKLRGQNGHAKPWDVRFWGVGNEAWGCGGNMTAEYYADVYKRFATYMGGSSGRVPLFRIASGASSGDFHWTEVLMREIPPDLMQGVALHHYAVIDWSKKSSATDFSLAEYFSTMQRTLLMDDLVKGHITVMDRYDPAKKVALVVDEWGGWYEVEPGTNPAFLFQQNTMRDAMIAGVTLNIFNSHCDRVKMANIAQTVNVLQALVLTDQARLILTPTYHVFAMYAVHQDGLLLPIDVATSRYVSGSSSLPAVSASASRDREGVTHLSLVNIDAGKEQEVTIDLRGMTFATAQGSILASAHVQDHNTFDQPNHVKPAEFTDLHIAGKTIRLTLPPCSVVVLAVR
jgi:alpha-N-arabinofuranosidase